MGYLTFVAPHICERCAEVGHPHPGGVVTPLYNPGKRYPLAMMKLRTLFLAFFAALFLFHAFPMTAQTAQQAQVAAAADLADRRKALNDLFATIWEDRLSHEPEFASTIGDKRWNDQLTDYSVETYNT